MEFYSDMFTDLKALPREYILFGFALIAIFAIYTIVKARKQRVPSFFENELGKEFRSHIRKLFKSRCQIKSEQVKRQLKDINKTIKRIYKKIINLSSNEINKKLWININKVDRQTRVSVKIS